MASFIKGGLTMFGYLPVVRLIKLTLGVLGAFGAAILLFAPTQTIAQEDTGSASSSALMDEITVSARRREERLLDQPMSISAMTGEQMQVQGIYSIDQASKFVPNVTLTSDDRANNTRVVIRGIGGGFPDPVFVFGSGMYIDGHYVPTSLGGYMSTLDIERVELLRGPQGTLFGKNVTGGLVNIISTKPQPDFDSSITVRLAEDGEQALRGMINVPFSDTVYGRFSVAAEEFDGYYYNQNLDIDSGFTESKSARAALRFQPNANWTVDTSLSISRKDDDNLGGQCQNTLRDAPQWGGGAGNLERRLYVGAREDYWAICDADVAAGDFVHSSEKVTWSNVDEEMFNLGVQWDSDGAVGQLDNATVSFKGSYRDMQYNYLADRDYSSWPIDAIGTGSKDGATNETFGFELLFEAQASDRLQFTVGVNYFDETAFNGSNTCYDLFVDNGASDSVTCVDTGLHFELVPNNPTGADVDPTQDPDLWPNAPRINGGGPGPFGGEVSVWNKSTGVFGHVTYDINDQWTLDVGARWTEDDREFHNFEFASTGCDASVDPQNLCAYTLPVDIAHVNDSGFFNQASDTFSEVTPMVSLTRNLASGDTLHSGMFYFLYSEGFLTGGFNTEVNANIPAGGPDLAYDPEQVNNFEIGFKGQFLGGDVQLMADVFFMDYKDQQKKFELANPEGEFGTEDPVELVSNIAKSSISGLELELRAAFWEGGFVSLDVGYIKNEYDDYTFEDPANPGTIIDRTEFLINDFTPDMTINLAVQHEFRLGNGGSITPRLNMNWQDDYEWAAETESWPKNAPKSGCHQDSFATFDGRVTYRPGDGDWQVSAFGRNITDERYIEFCENDRNVWLWRLGRPASYGLEFSAHFGRD
jgi:iron complex outermembrane receptor protein